MRTAVLYNFLLEATIIASIAILLMIPIRKFLRKYLGSGVLCFAWLLVAVGLFHSIMWGAIFTLATTGLGRYTSAASGVFMTGVVGGAILPLLQGAVADSLGAWRWSWLIVLFGELVMLSYALVGSRPKEKAE